MNAYDRHCGLQSADCECEEFEAFDPDEYQCEFDDEGD